MSTKLRTGPRQRLSTNVSWSLWRKRFARSSARRSSQRSWLLLSSSENSRDGKAYLAKSQSSKNFKLRETTCLSNSVEMSRRLRKSSRLGPARVSSKSQGWRNHLKPTMSLIWSQPSYGLDSYPKRSNQIRKLPRACLATFLQWTDSTVTARMCVSQSKNMKITSSTTGTTRFLKP